MLISRDPLVRGKIRGRQCKPAAIAAIGLWLAVFSPLAHGQPLSHKACDALDQLVTTTPAPPPNKVAWQETIAAIRNADAAASVVMVGDSLIRGWPAKRSAAAFPGQIVANLGIGGTRTQGVLWLLADPLVRALRPRQVVLLIGTNNLAGGDAPCAIAAGILSTIAAIESVWNSPNLTVVEIPPRGKGLTEMDQDRTQTNQMITNSRVVAANTTFIDISPLLIATAGAYQADNLHFTSAGYDALQQMLGNQRDSPR